MVMARLVAGPQCSSASLADQVNTLTGTGLMVLGIVLLLIANRNHQQSVDRLHRRELTLPSRWSLSVIISLVLAALGMGLAIYLAPP